MSTGAATPPAGTPPQKSPRTDVRVVEVGPRDGLQNEPHPVPTDVKIAFVNALSAAGLPVVEATSFVNPKAVPQMADAAEVMIGIDRRPGVLYPVLVPNERGLQRALAANVTEIALFTSATEAFSQANVGTSISGTFERFAPVIEQARAAKLWVRGYVSVAFGCPYSGDVPASAVAEVAEHLFALGCAEVSIADTIGVATPDTVNSVLEAILPGLPVDRVALHFHDTGGLAIANVAASLEHGVATYDAAAGGLGGCPFAPGAPGNLATESLLEFLSGQGIETGVNIDQVRTAVSAIRAEPQPAGITP